jgi:hypothetical protein
MDEPRHPTMNKAKKLDRPPACGPHKECVTSIRTHNNSKCSTTKLTRLELLCTESSEHFVAVVFKCWWADVWRERERRGPLIFIPVFGFRSRPSTSDSFTPSAATTTQTTDSVSLCWLGLDWQSIANDTLGATSVTAAPQEVDVLAM